MPNLVSPEQWREARRALLAEEKNLTRAKDALAAARRALPAVRVTREYVFAGEGGPVTLGGLFAGRRQLAVYHFMFAPDWEAGCKSCSYVADHLEPTQVHLAQRDTTLVLASRAPLAKLLAFRTRMGWTLPWVSVSGSGFAEDLGVGFDADAIARGPVDYNYGAQRFPMTEAPGLSVFLREEDGSVLHTYSTYGRGLDDLMTTYDVLDLTPLGRHEDPKSPMAWIRHHDRYPAHAD